MNISWPFLLSLLGGCNSKESAKLHETHPKVMTKMVKKCSTLCSSDQRFIRKRNTTYRIHTLIQQLKVLVASSSKTVLWNAWFSRILIFGQPHRLVTKFWNPLAPLLWGKKNSETLQYNLLFCIYNVCMPILLHMSFYLDKWNFIQTKLRELLTFLPLTYLLTQLFLVLWKYTLFHISLCMALHVCLVLMSSWS